MLFDKLLITILCSLNIVYAAITTQLVVTTNIVGGVITRTSVFDNAADTDAAADATAAIANTGVQTITYTSTDPNGILLTRTTVTNVGSLSSGTGKSTGTSTGTNTATNTNTNTNTATGTAAATQTGLVTSTYTSTDPNGVTLTRTTTYALTSSTAAAAAAANTGKSSSSKTSKTTTGSYVNNGRPDPSTSMTPYPVSAVTTLSMDKFYTVTQGTTKTYTSARAHTTIYATVVISGQTIVRSTTFAQRFSSQYTEVAVPSSGSIGLGSLTGTIGVIKTNMKTTIKYNAADNLNLNSATLFGLFTLFISLWI